MATLNEKWDLHLNNDLLNRVVIAVVTAAVAIQAESDQTANHEARMHWVKTTMANPVAMGQKFMFSVVTQSSVADAGLGVSDVILQSVIDSLVNVHAPYIAAV